MNKKLKRWRKRIALALVLFALLFALTELLPLSAWLGSERNAVYAEFVLYLIPYTIAGYDVLLKAARNIKNGQVFDENFLMAVATIGAFSPTPAPIWPKVQRLCYFTRWASCSSNTRSAKAANRLRR